MTIISPKSLIIKKIAMLQRLYIHNFRCLENFELNLKDMPSALLIGKNGVGKSTIVSVLKILQNIGRGVDRLNILFTPKDFTNERFEVPIRIEIEVLLDGEIYQYSLAIEFLENTEELAVVEEKFLVSGKASGNLIYSRVDRTEININDKAIMSVNWRFIALPLIQEKSETDPLYIFKTWLAQMIILAPIPSLMTGESHGETLEPKPDASNFGEWVSGLLSRYPAAYSQIEKYLTEVMPDIQGFRNEKIGRNAKSMIVRFEANNATLSVDFEDLSDGEKCFFLCAVVLAANKYYGPLFCFWDEPDNYLSLSEVGHFIMALRRSFKNSGQILITSHNEEAIRKFSDENTFVLDRKSHLEPTLIRRLSDLSFTGDLINSLISGDIEI
jgi:ABC-type cobalamin/Fe3+-siderophores transport system ATPase subunit